jgi:hypothetical protein
MITLRLLLALVKKRHQLDEHRLRIEILLPLIDDRPSIVRIVEREIQ